MDVFKILSRSSKPTSNTHLAKLPSSGAVANPQLFGGSGPQPSPTQTFKNRKRKRSSNGTGQSDTLPKELDFFNGEDHGSRGKSDKTAVLSPDKTQEAENNGSIRPAIRADDGLEIEDEAYDEDECKRILRTHKVKIVILEDFAVQQDDTAPSEKKSKKRTKHKDKEVIEKAPKKAKLQLYPRPLTSFKLLRQRHGVSRKLAENVLEQGYTVPTEVQLAALPLLLGYPHGTPQSSSGDITGPNVDLLTVAPTGSGKTIAFLIPIIQALLSEARTKTETSASAPGPRAIIIAPTRELAFQIVNEARKLTKNTRVKAALMKKGMEVVERTGQDIGHENESDIEDSEDEKDDPLDSVKGNREALARRSRSEIVKAAILVATPLALLNALRLKDGEVSSLPSVRHLVFDEADVLLDPLFREQSLAVWNACSNPLLNVSLWSATMGSNIEDLVISTMKRRWDTLSSLSEESLPRCPSLVRLIVGLKDTAIPNVQHKLIYAATEQGKLLGLRQLLHPSSAPSTDNTPTLRPPFLVFTQTIPRAVALHSELLYDIPPEAGGSSRIAVLHADLSSTARENIMARFRRGEVWVLITTDLLARGVDFQGLNGVVNYDVPNSAAAYIHRVGRTGRAGREGGVAVTFYTLEDIPYVKNVANVIKASEKLRGTGEGEGEIKQWLLDALPTPSKRDKQKLKKRGVEARRTVRDEEGKTNMRISTKSGYERRMENNRKGAIFGSRRRQQEESKPALIGPAENGSESEFEGFGN